ASAKSIKLVLINRSADAVSADVQFHNRPFHTAAIYQLTSAAPAVKLIGREALTTPNSFATVLPAWDYQTRIMRFALKHDLPLPVQQLAFRYDLFVRRLCGWLLARRGWIVVYDRHPAERLEPGKRSFRNAIKSVLDRFYAWPVDVTFWLTGDYRTIYLRK